MHLRGGHLCGTLFHDMTPWRGVICGLCCQKQVSQAGISNYIPQFTVGCNYLSLPEIPASGNKVHIYMWNNLRICGSHNVQSISIISLNCHWKSIKGKQILWTFNFHWLISLGFNIFIWILYFHEGHKPIHVCGVDVSMIFQYWNCMLCFS